MDICDFLEDFVDRSTTLEVWSGEDDFCVNGSWSKVIKQLKYHTYLVDWIEVGNNTLYIQVSHYTF